MSFESALRADILAAKAGDVPAYERLVRENKNLVSSIALAIVRDRSASEDVAQDVFVTAWQNLRTLRNADSFVPWLRELTRNRAKMHVRARSRFGARHAPWDGEPSITATSPNADAELVDREERAAIDAAFADLDADEREILTLFYREEAPIAHLAELLGVSEAAVKKRLERARASLRESVLSRFAEVARASVPGGALVSAVSAAIAAATPSKAAAATIGAKHAASLSVKLAALAGPLFGILLGVAGVLFGARCDLSRARDERERRDIRRIALVGGLWIPITAFIMWIAVRIWSATLYLGSFLALLPIFGFAYLWWLPRATARRVAADIAEDPSARDRYTRENRIRVVAFALGAGIGLVATIRGYLIMRGG